MDAPFTLDQFLGVFRRYNEAVWPMPAVLIILAIIAVVAALSGGPRASRLVSLILAALWIWAGVAYHLTFFRDINPMASIFAIAFIAEATMFLWLGVIRGSLNFDVRSGGSGLIGGAIIVYSLIAYPLIGVALGHALPAAPTFGVPCPMTIFTFGLIIWMTAPRSRLILIVPVLWSVVAFFAAVEFGMWEDLGLTVAGIVAVAATFWPLEKLSAKSTPQLT
jgi:hypothetical protein